MEFGVVFSHLLGLTEGGGIAIGYHRDSDAIMVQTNDNNEFPSTWSLFATNEPNF